MAKLPRPNSTVLWILLVAGIFAVCYCGIFWASRPLVLLGVSSDVLRDEYGINVDSLPPKGTQVLDVQKARSFFALRGKCSREVADAWMKEQIQGEQQMVRGTGSSGTWGFMRFAKDEPFMNEFTLFYETDPELYDKGIRRFKYVGYHEPSQTWFWLVGSY